MLTKEAITEIANHYYYVFLLNNIKKTQQDTLPNIDLFFNQIVSGIKQSLSNKEYLEYVRIVKPELDYNYGFKSHFLNFSSFFILKSNYFSRITINNEILSMGSNIHFGGRKNIYQYLINNGVDIDIVELFKTYLSRYKNNELNSILKEKFSPNFFASNSISVYFSKQVKPIIEQLIDKFINKLKETAFIRSYTEQEFKLIKKQLVNAIGQYILNGMVVDIEPDNLNTDLLFNRFKEAIHGHYYYNKYLVVIKTNKTIKYLAYINGKIYSTTHDIPEYMTFIYEDIFLRQIFNNIYTNKILINKLSASKLGVYAFYPIAIFNNLLKIKKSDSLTDIGTRLLKRVDFVMKLIAQNTASYPAVLLNLANKGLIMTSGTTNPFLISYAKKYYEIKPENSNTTIPIKLSDNNYVINTMFLNQLGQFVMFEKNTTNPKERLLMLNPLK